MMTIEETLNYLNSHHWSQWRLGLSRTRELLERLGNPQKSLKFVHIAGTNGKGSTSAMIASMLIASGYRTGMYPSPFIERFNERIQINGEQISDEDLCEITETVRAECDAMEDHPTHFEIITAIGMLYFKRRKCDIVVLEVGLGGEFDSTNVIDAPELCIITNIGFDHTDYLGNTLAEIASAKAGIIKSGAGVVCYPNVPEVINVIDEKCRLTGSSFKIADFSRVERISSDLSRQTFIWKPEKDPAEEQKDPSEEQPADTEKKNPSDKQLAAAEQKDPSDKRSAAADQKEITIEMPLIGGYQIRNAAVSLTAAEELARSGWKITPESMAEGMSKVKWPARFELLGNDPVFILDGGHNKQCAEAVAESLRKYFPDGGLTLLIGMLEDKDYEAAVTAILPFTARCICVTPDSERALPAEKLAETIRKQAARAYTGGSDPAAGNKAPEVICSDSVSDAVRECMNGSAPVLAFGSLYLAGEIRTAYRNLKLQYFSS